MRLPPIPKRRIDQIAHSAHSAHSTQSAINALLWVLLLALLFDAWRDGQPVALPEATGSAVGQGSGAVQFPCVSYAPFRRPGATPFDPALQVSPAEIEADLRLLASVTGCVRTYGVDQGLEAVPAVARRLGLKVVLGAWIGRDPLANAAQLQRALTLAREYPDTIRLLVVGNEVLLRQELTPQALAALLASARRASPVPVAYADVWAFWQRHRAVLTPHVDVVAAHILPYWEDEPVGVETAVDYVHRLAAQLAAEFAPLPVFIAETGWPAAGRQRGPARPGRLEQAYFARELLARQTGQPLDVNFIEGFDQPWKRALEGAMGGAWGLFDAAGTQRVPLTGPLVADPHWAIRIGAAGVGFLGAGVGGALAGILAVPAVQALAQWSRSPWEWLIGGASLMLLLGCGWQAARRWQAVGQGRERPGEDFLATLQLLTLAIAVIDAFWLVVDGRYRPLPWAALAAPAVLLLALQIVGRPAQPGCGAGNDAADDGVPGRLQLWHIARRGLSVSALLLAVLLVASEGVDNTAALRFAAVLAAVAVASFKSVR